MDEQQGQQQGENFIMIKEVVEAAIDRFRQELRYGSEEIERIQQKNSNSRFKIFELKRELAELEKQEYKSEYPSQGRSCSTLTTP